LAREIAPKMAAIDFMVFTWEFKNYGNVISYPVTCTDGSVSK
jgi:hypothetical protein